jgi:prepilin-type N-terminal cleavage/methylation domain-containing protein
LIRRHQPLRSIASPATSGFTLLEVVVTLVLLGLAAALVAPAIRTDAGPADAFTTVVAQSREAAVRRSQTLVLQVDAHGRWQLSTTSGVSLGTGTMPAGDRDAISLRITPLGACFADSSSAHQWDALACARPGSEAR